MIPFERSPSAEFLGRVDDFLALQACFSRRFNLLPSHWLALHSALASVRVEQEEWVCAEFSTADIARDSLTSRETVRRSMHWLLAKGLVLRTARRYVVSPLTISVMRQLLDRSSADRGQSKANGSARKQPAHGPMSGIPR